MRREKFVVVLHHINSQIISILLIISVCSTVINSQSRLNNNIPVEENTELNRLSINEVQIENISESSTTKNNSLIPPEPNYFLNNLSNLKRNLLPTSIGFEFVYKADLFSNLYGGIEKGTKYFDNFDLIFSVDFEELLSLSNTSLTAHVLGNNGESVTELIGSSQSVSNIETIPEWKVYQFFVEREFIDNRFSVLMGLYDLNSEFDVRDASGIFFNASHGIGDEIAQSGQNGPSIFPTTSATLRLKYQF